MIGIEFLYFYRSADGRLIALSSPSTSEGLTELTAAEFDRETKRVTNALSKRRAARAEEREVKRTELAKKLGISNSDLHLLK